MALVKFKKKKVKCSNTHLFNVALVVDHRHQIVDCVLQLHSPSLDVINCCWFFLLNFLINFNKTSRFYWWSDFFSFLLYVFLMFSFSFFLYKYFLKNKILSNLIDLLNAKCFQFVQESNKHVKTKEFGIYWLITNL